MGVSVSTNTVQWTVCSTFLVFCTGTDPFLSLLQLESQWKTRPVLFPSFVFLPVFGFGSSLVVLTFLMNLIDLFIHIVLGNSIIAWLLQVRNNNLKIYVQNWVTPNHNKINKKMNNVQEILGTYTVELSMLLDEINATRPYHGINLVSVRLTYADSPIKLDTSIGFRLMK